MYLCVLFLGDGTEVSLDVSLGNMTGEEYGR
jgi:hypothetical protein